MLISSAFSVEWVGGRAEVFVFVFVIVFRLVFTTHLIISLLSRMGGRAEVFVFVFVIVFRLVFTTHLVFAFSVEWVGELKFLSLAFTKYLIISLLSRMGGWAQVADMELRLWARLWLSLLRWNLNKRFVDWFVLVFLWLGLLRWNLNKKLNLDLLNYLCLTSNVWIQL